MINSSDYREAGARVRAGAGARVRAGASAITRATASAKDPSLILSNSRGIYLILAVWMADLAFEETPGCATCRLSIIARPFRHSARLPSGRPHCTSRAFPSVVQSRSINWTDSLFSIEKQFYFQVFALQKTFSQLAAREANPDAQPTAPMLMTARVS